MPALISTSENKYSALKRVTLGIDDKERQEKWFQELLFAYPEIIPIDELNPGSRKFIPVCRELTIPKSGGISVFLDIFGVTPEGKLVLIECKLWNNPQARREVIAQALEYASLMRQWSYGDLTVRLQGQLGTKSPNPLYDALIASGEQVDEGRFVDGVSASLKAGDFLVVIAGDGIRSDVHAIADHLNAHSSMATRLALVEFQIWEGENGERIVLPNVPMKTELLTHRVYMSADGEPITIEAESDQEARTAAVIDPEGAKRREEDAAFWKAFCDTVAFDHPDQAPARRGGYGWAKIPLPEPLNSLTAYRTAKGEAGLFLRLKDEEGKAVYHELLEQQDRMQREIGVPVEMTVSSDGPFSGTFSILYAGDPFEDENFLSWLLKYANIVVSTLRTFSAQIS